MALDDTKLRKLFDELRDWRPTTIFFVVAIDPDSGERTWFATAGGPWPDELEKTARNYRTLCPEDSRPKDDTELPPITFPPDPADN